MNRRSRYRMVDHSGRETVYTMLLHSEMHDGCWEGVPMLSNIVIGQHTGIDYIQARHEYIVKCICTRCKLCRDVAVPEEIVRTVPALYKDEFLKISQAMEDAGCLHERSWVMSPVMTRNDDEEETQFRIVKCTACKTRVEVVR